MPYNQRPSPSGGHTVHVIPPIFSDTPNYINLAMYPILNKKNHRHEPMIHPMVICFSSLLIYPAKHTRKVLTRVIRYHLPLGHRSFPLSFLHDHSQIIPGSLFTSRTKPRKRPDTGITTKTWETGPRSRKRPQKCLENASNTEGAAEGKWLIDFHGFTK